MAEYIDREAAIARLKRIVEVNRLRTDRAWFTPDGVEYLINEIPAADAQPVVRGKWIINGWSIRCSECRYDMPFSVRNFCPNCGADMREAPHG